MVISHEYRYVFVENPLTASWALRQELCTYYGGEPILHKHASYVEFARNADARSGGYVAFTTVRDPLDKLVSRYVKLKSDHRLAFSASDSVASGVADYADLRKHPFAARTDVSFETFFLRYYRRPYSDLVDVRTKDLDFVIRYERLQEDVAAVLRLLNIRQVRPVPVMNKTVAKRADWGSYYGPAIIEQAKRVCGPFMEK